jgi:hypothetical protein
MQGRSSRGGFSSATSDLTAVYIGILFPDFSSEPLNITIHFYEARKARKPILLKGNEPDGRHPIRFHFIIDFASKHF